MTKRVMFILIFVVLLLVFLSYGDNDSLSREEAKNYAIEYLDSVRTAYTDSFESEWEDGVLTNGEFKMPFWYDINGEKPEKGYPMYISMHGGGGTSVEANNQQWENQKGLYGVVGGIYWVPRSPTDSWNMWHQGYMDGFLMKAITYAVDKLDADPDRIYLMGYSAGGDGTFNLAPRLADRFGAAAMMAGHPGDAKPRNLRNIPFAIYMGGDDSAYNRNGLAQKWANTLDSLSKADSKGFTYTAHIYEGKGHWMDNLDKESLPWMSQFSRHLSYDRVIWIQDDVLANRKYNLEVADPKAGRELTVAFDKRDNRVIVERCDYNAFTLWLNDDILNLEEPIKVLYDGKLLFEGDVDRTVSNIRESIDGRYDPLYIFPAKIEVSI